MTLAFFAIESATTLRNSSGVLVIGLGCEKLVPERLVPEKLAPGGRIPIEVAGTADSPVLRLQDVRKSFGGDLVLDGVSISVGRGETVGGVVANLVLAVRGASAVTLISAILVLGGALAAGHRHRVYDAVILKTLGATRARLIGAFALEYLLIGLATAAFGVLAGSVAAWAIVSPAHFTNSAARLLLPASKIAPLTRTQIVSIEPGNTQVIHGSNFSVTLKLGGEVLCELW